MAMNRIFAPIPVANRAASSLSSVAVPYLSAANVRGWTNGSEEESSPSSSLALAANSNSRSDSASMKHAYYLAKTILRSSVVLQVVQGHISSPSSNDVIFGKETEIDFKWSGATGVPLSLTTPSLASRK